MGKHIERGIGESLTHRQPDIRVVGLMSGLKPYPAYKDSGVEWLGDIPAHWEVKRLHTTVTTCQNGLWGDEPDGLNDVVCVRVADFDRVTHTVKLDHLTFRSVAPAIFHVRRLRLGDLLLEKSGGGDNQPVGTVVLNTYGGPAICSNFIARMSVHEGSDPRHMAFLHAALYAYRINTRSIKQNTGIQNLDSASYLNESVAFPAMSEQCAIAAFLSRETAKIDALVAKKERLIELLQEKRTALITQAVTNGLGPDVPMKDARVAWLGEIPAHWDVLRLFRLTPSDRSIMYGIVLPGPNVKDGVPIVKGGDVSSERLHLDMLNRTHPDIEAGHVRSRLRGGDLVYAIRGSIGAVAIIPDELDGANLTQDAARVAYTTATHGRWLLYTLKSAAIFSQLDAGALGATIRGINIRDLKRAVVPQPPQSEQRAIAAFLDRGTAKIDALIAKGHEAIERLRELRTALISAAVTGKIDVRPDAGQFPETTS